MSTTVILADNISIYASPQLVTGFALNYILNNTGGAALDAQIELRLVQDVSGLNETSTTFQSWKRFDIFPGDKVYFEGTYFLTDENSNLMVSKINPEVPQKFQITCVITGGSTDQDRLALVKIPDTIEYSKLAGRF